MVATVATCKGVQHGATIYHKCHCYMVLHCLLHRCHRKPLLVFATMEESSRTQGARL